MPDDAEVKLRNLLHEYDDAWDSIKRVDPTADDLAVAIESQIAQKESWKFQLDALRPLCEDMLAALKFDHPYETDVVNCPACDVIKRAEAALKGGEL